MDDDGPSTEERPKHTAEKRPLPSRSFYPRKRALVACEICRRRKIKCDNAKPSCKSCQNSGLQCTYADSKYDRSSYDLASQDILNQIGDVRELLQAQNAHLSSLLPRLADTPGGYPSHPQPDAAAASSHASVPSWPGASNAGASPEEDMLLPDSLEFAETSSGKCEDILEWPIFEGRFRRSETEALIFNPDLAHEGPSDQHSSFSVESDSVRRCRPSRGVQEEDMMGFIREFLANVHIKNPILDADDVQRMAKDALEHGLKWDAPSCLVLIASALGCLSSAFTLDYVTEDLAQSSSIEDTRDYATAESYYVAAGKRIGLLKPAILTVQCSFLLGVYEMYSLRPIRAWTSFNRACQLLQVCLRTKPEAADPHDERLECRLYWSCLKSECEIRMDIDVPLSGLGKLTYPVVLPTPPISSRSFPATSPESVYSTPHDDASSKTQTDLEKSWGYYLADIAVRQIANRLVNTFYNGHARSWLTMPVERMVRVAEELEMQMVQWHAHIPKLVAGPDLSRPMTAETQELCSLLQSRLVEFRERIFRPFLYLAIHSDPEQPAHIAVEPYARRCLDACLQHSLCGSHRHRHHGTWYQNRKIFAESLLVLAAVKSQRVAVPPNWRDAVRATILSLRFWAAEAPDLARAKDILQTLLDEMDGQGLP